MYTLGRAAWVVLRLKHRDNKKFLGPRPRVGMQIRRVQLRKPPSVGAVAI